MKSSFVDFVLNKFDTEADKHDKFKISVVTGMTVGVLSGFTTAGLVNLFDIDPSSFVCYLLLIFMSLFFFRPVKFWYVCRYLDDVEEGALQQPKNEAKKPKKG